MSDAYDEKLLKCFAAIANTDAVIVGGQALAIWAIEFNIDLFVSEHGVTRDLDVFGSKEDLQSIAKATSAKARFQPAKFISSLVGIVEFFSENVITNVDVIHRVYGMNGDAVRKNAVTLSLCGFPCKVMHPIHVLESRLINYGELAEKRNEQGLNQIRLAIEVARNFILLLISQDKERMALTTIEKIVSLSKTSGARAAAKGGVNLIATIPFDAIRNDNFHRIRKPRILVELTARSADDAMES